MSREKERFRRLVSWMRSEERCKPLSPCCSAVGDKILGGPPCLSGSLGGGAEVVLLGASSTFSEVDGAGCLPPSDTSAGSCGASPSPRSPWAFRALRSFRLLSYSRSWPRKLKLGEIDGRRSLTNLPRSADNPGWCLVLQWVIPTLSVSLGHHPGPSTRPPKERSFGEPLPLGPWDALG